MNPVWAFGPDPWLAPPSVDDRTLVEACGGTIDETVAGVA